MTSVQHDIWHTWKLQQQYNSGVFSYPTLPTPVVIDL